MKKHKSIIQSIRREMPPAKRVITPKKNEVKADRVGRKAKHKSSVEKHSDMDCF